MKIKFVSAIDEFPWVILRKERYPRIYTWLYLKYFYKLFDGLIIMTNTLMNYYKDKSKKSAKLFHFPMSVEINRFTKGNLKLDIKDRYIAYTGWDVGSYNIDGIDILIDAFDVIASAHKDVKLYLIGKFGDQRYRHVKNLNLENRIVFTGPIHRDEIPLYLNCATVLALARPNSLQATGGFSTKLGEYLASGTPTVVTKVGEITDYIKDRKHAFLAEPGDVKSFADNLDYVLSNIDIANQVGLNGQRLAKTEFYYGSHLNKISEYLRSL